MSVIRTPPGARWDCHACGDCCRLYDLGPVEPEIIRGLRDRKIEDHWAPAKDAPWFEVRRAPDGREVYFLTHRNGQCVFLRDDNLCAVHGLFGSEAKPAFCREFPFHVLDDPRGTVAVVRPSCSSAHRGVGGGTPVADQAAAAVALPRVMGRRRWAPAEVAVLPDAALPIEAWMDLEERVIASITDDGEPEAQIAAIRATLLGAVGRPRAASDAQRARLACGAVIEALRRLMDRAANDPDPRAEAHRVAFARSMRDLLVAALAGQARPLAPDGRAYLAQVLRTFLLAKGQAPIGSVAEGLGAFLVQVAVVRGAAPGQGPIDAAGVGAVVAKWSKLTDNPAIAGVLRMARPALYDAFVHVEGL